MLTIDEAIDKLIGIEGGHVNHPSDRGGETIWGMTVDNARRYGYHGPMRTMPRSEAARIYKQRYIIDPSFDVIWELSPKIGYELFDTGVNAGPSVPSKWLQEYLNVLNRQGKDYPDILEDGDIGPATLRSLAAYLKVRGAEGELVLLNLLNCEQGVFYKSLAQKRKTQEDFMYGWVRTRIEIH